jgi:hypothetical protein
MCTPCCDLLSPEQAIIRANSLRKCEALHKACCTDRLLGSLAEAGSDREWPLPDPGGDAVPFKVALLHELKPRWPFPTRFR